MSKSAEAVSVGGNDLLTSAATIEMPLIYAEYKPFVLVGSTFATVTSTTTLYYGIVLKGRELSTINFQSK